MLNLLSYMLSPTRRCYAEQTARTGIGCLFETVSGLSTKDRHRKNLKAKFGKFKTQDLRYV